MSDYERGAIPWCINRLKFHYGNLRGRWTESSGEIWEEEFERIGQRARIGIIEQVLESDALPTISAVRRMAQTSRNEDEARNPYAPPQNYCPPERGIPMVIAAFERQWRADHNGQPPDKDDPFMVIIKRLSEKYRESPVARPRYEEPFSEEDDPFA